MLICVSLMIVRMKLAFSQHCQCRACAQAVPTGTGLYCVDPAFVLDADGLCAGAALAVLGA